MTFLKARYWNVITSKPKRKGQFCLVSSQKHFFSPSSIVLKIGKTFVAVLWFSPVDFCMHLSSGLFADSSLEVLQRELAWECDYKREAECAKKFRCVYVAHCSHQDLRIRRCWICCIWLLMFLCDFCDLYVCLVSRSLLEGDEYFEVPEVIDELSGKRVLAMDLVQGVPLDCCVDLDQETRNQVQLDAVVPHYVALF